MFFPTIMFLQLLARYSTTMPKNSASRRRGRLQRPNSRNFKLAAFIFVVTIWNILYLWTSQPSDGRSATTKSSVMIESEDAVTAFSQLQLFVTAFPAGFEQDFRPVMIRSLQFFWPTEYLRLTLVLDDTVYQNNKERDQMNDTVKSFFNFDLRDHIDVVYNPRSDPEEFHGGYNIQQLIGFWADNFTDAAYIGIMDDDTILSKAVQPEDLFDERGRPHAIVRYTTGLTFAKGWYNGTNWALGRSAYTNAMNYFPVILHRKHLPMIRQEILRVHHEFDTFDNFFKFLTIGGKKGGYSQFCIMFEYLWMHHRNDYNWHFEADGNSGPYFPNGFPIGSDIASTYQQVTPGSPAENGVTAEMLCPFPRVAVHGGWIPGGRMASKRPRKTEDIMRRGYCFSQALHLFNSSSNTISSPELELMQRRCKRYDVITGADIFVDGEWLFELHEK